VDDLVDQTDNRGLAGQILQVLDKVVITLAAEVIIR
jgi:hypothetical protein